MHVESVVVRRSAVALILAIAVPSAWASTAQADNSSQQVSVTVTSGATSSTQDVTVSGLETSCPRYAGPPVEEYAGTGAPTAPTTPDAWTIASVLSCLAQPIQLASVTEVVVDPAGRQETLTPGDLAIPSDFSNPQEAPLIYSDGTNLIYQRPSRDLDAANVEQGQVSDDDNAADEIAVAAPAPFTLQVIETPPPPLRVQINRSSSAVNENQSVDLSATVNALPAGEQPIYSWNFGGGAAGAQTSSAPAPVVTFRTQGVWKITLQVTDAEGGEGEATATVRVASPTPTRTSTTPHPTGPVKSSGGSPGAKPGRSRTTMPAPKATPENPTPKTTPFPSPGGPLTTRRTTPAHTPAKRPAPATAPAAATATPRTHTAPGVKATTPQTAPATSPSPKPRTTPARSPSPKPQSTPVTSPPQKPKPKPVHHHHAPVPPGTRRVQGLLLGAMAPVAAAASPLVRLVRPAAAAAPALRGARSGSGPAIILAAAGVLLLLLLGARREIRGRRPPPSNRLDH